MDRQNKVNIEVGGAIFHITLQKLPDGKWSVMGWGDSVTVRSINVESDVLIRDFCEILLIARRVGITEERVDYMVASIREGVD